MKEYVEFESIPEPFFLSKPFKKNRYEFEDPGEHELSGDLIDIAAKVCSRFMQKHMLKIPYFYKQVCDRVPFIMGESLYSLPPLKDCSGYGWLHIIKQEFEKEMERSLSAKLKPSNKKKK